MANAGAYSVPMEYPMTPTSLPGVPSMFASGLQGGNMVGAKGPPLRHQRLSECSDTSSCVPKLRWGSEAKSGAGTRHVESPLAWLHSFTGTKRTWSGPNLSSRVILELASWNSCTPREYSIRTNGKMMQDEWHYGTMALWMIMAYIIIYHGIQVRISLSAWTYSDIHIMCAKKLLLQCCCHHSFVLDWRHAASGVQQEPRRFQDCEATLQYGTLHLSWKLDKGRNMMKLAAHSFHQFPILWYSLIFFTRQEA